MKLSREDQEILTDLGVSEKDYRQIEEASHARLTTYALDGKEITRDAAIRLLGRRDYLSGMARSAFHWSAARALTDGSVVYFDSSNYLRS